MLERRRLLCQRIEVEAAEVLMTFQCVKVIGPTWSTSSKTPFWVNLKQIVYDILRGVIEIRFSWELQLSVKYFVEGTSLATILERHFTDVHAINDTAKCPQIGRWQAFRFVQHLR